MASESKPGLFQRFLQHLVWLNRPLYIISFVFVCLTWLVSSLVDFSFPDLWWQLREGIDYLSTGTVQATIPLSYAPQIPGPHLDYHLYEVGLALLYQWGGFPLLRVIFILMASLPFGLTIVILLRQKRLDSFSVLCLIMALACLFARVQQRPELIAFSVMLLLGLHLYFLENQRLLLRILLPIFLMAVWANLHASFILGMAMGIAWAGSQWLPALIRFRPPDPAEIKKPLATLAALFVGGCLSPTGWHRWIEPFQLQSSTWSKLNSSEMWPPPLNIVLFYAFILGLVLTVTLIYRRVRWNDLWLLVLPTLFLFMFVSNYRYIAFMGICCCLLAVMKPHENRPTRQSKFLAIVYVTFCIPLVISLMLIMFPIYTKGLFQGKFNERTFDYGALHHLSQHVPEARVFSDIRASSFSAFFFPDFEYYIHTGFSRFKPEALETFFTMNHDPTAFLKGLRKMNHPCVVVGGWNSHWALAMDTAPDYRLVYISERGSLYVPEPLQDRIPVEINAQVNLLPQISHVNSTETQAEILSEHLPRLGRDERGVLFLEYWIQNQKPEHLQQIINELPPGQSRLLMALSGREGSYPNLPPRVRVRQLVHAGNKEAAKTLYHSTISYGLRRRTLEHLFLSPLGTVHPLSKDDSGPKID
jgi:hypothetical protein